MKRTAALLLSLAMTFTTAACGSSNKSKEQNLSNEQIKGEITVSCYDEAVYSHFLQEAGRLFEKKYPGTKINFQGFTPMPETEAAGGLIKGAAAVDVLGEKDAQKKSDYINKINTQLMGGNGPDILMTDIIPCYKYADKDILENLSRYIDQDPSFKKSDYRENILNASRYKDGQFILPLGFDFNLFSYDKEFIDKKEQAALNDKKEFTLEELIGNTGSSFEKNMSDKLKLFDIYGEFEFFDKLFGASYDKYVDVPNKKANFNDGSFAKILNLSKEVVSKGYIKGDFEFNPEKDDMETITKSFLETKYYFNIFKHYDIFRFFMPKTGAGSKIELGSNAVLAGKELSTTSTIGGLITSNSGKKSIEITMGAVMNSNSKNKQTAWEFIKFLSSEEIQSSLSLIGQPVNKKAGEKRAKSMVLNSLGTQNLDESTEEMNGGQKEIYHSYMKTLEEFINSLDYVMIRDSMLDQLVNTEVKGFFDGTKTADEAAKTIQTKVELYLNE